MMHSIKHEVSLNINIIIIILIKQLFIKIKSKYN